MQKPGAVEEETRHIGRAFLDRSPPPECVEPVLQAGCTRRNISAILVAIAIVVSCCAMVDYATREGGFQPPGTSALGDDDARNVFEFATCR